MAQHSVMTSLVEAARRQLQTRGVYPNPVSKLDESPELIDRKKMLYSIGEMLGNVTRIITECLRGIARLPTAAVVLQRLRQIPVIESGEWLDVISEQFVDEAVVKVEAFGVRRAGTLRKHARPRNREAIRLDAQRLHELNILFVPMIVVICDVTCGVVHHVARNV